MERSKNLACEKSKSYEIRIEKAKKFYGLLNGRTDFLVIIKKLLRILDCT